MCGYTNRSVSRAILFVHYHLLARDLGASVLRSSPPRVKEEMEVVVRQIEWEVEKGLQAGRIEREVVMSQKRALDQVNIWDGEGGGKDEARLEYPDWVSMESPMKLKPLSQDM